VTWNSALVANGTHTISAQAQDNAGNLSSMSSVSVTVSNPALTFSSGLVGYWKFDDATGTTAADSSGNGNTGTLVGGVSWTNGIVRGCIAVNGTYGFVEVPSTPALEQVSNAVTLTAWINVHSNSSMQSIARKVINMTNDALPYAAYDLVVQDNGNQTFSARMAVSGTDGTTRGVALGTVQHAYGQWYLLAGVYNGSTVSIYVNGTLETTASYSEPILQTGQPLTIGQYGTVTDTVLGLIDEFRLYNRALTAAEIQQLAGPSAPAGLHIVTSN
jgi:concanavalin A-like lectin/glucanase superfamily protein